MKKIVFSIFLLILILQAFAQQPVKWTYHANKLSDAAYEVHLKAVIAEGWHVYAQQQPEHAIALPTIISFDKNPLLVLSEPVKETGELKQYKDVVLGISANQYAGKVDFVKVVRLKKKGRTDVTGSITFQACTDEKCLPPSTVSFNIALESN